MSERTFIVRGPNEHGLYPFSQRVRDEVNGVFREYEEKIAELTEAECDDLERQLHARRGERD